MSVMRGVTSALMVPPVTIYPAVLSVFVAKDWCTTPIPTHVLHQECLVSDRNMAISSSRILMWNKGLG